MRVFLILCCVLFLIGCTAVSVPGESVPASQPGTVSDAAVPGSVEAMEELMLSMTVPQRVGQLFLVRLQEDTALRDIGLYHLGGFVLFGTNFEKKNESTLRELLQSYQSAAEIPLLLAVDEEGGTVTRVSSYPAFRSSRFPSPRDAYSQGGLTKVLDVEEEKYTLLSSLGLNVNLGPVCDMADRTGAFMYKRSLGQDAYITSDFVSGTVLLARAYRVGSVLKHFPGYGNNSDTHTGIAMDNRSLEELWARDLLPFTAGISAKADCVLVSHTIVTAMDSELPASLSPAVHSFLRKDLGFSGVILTDDLDMQAITDSYGAGEAAVLAVLAGNDLLCSTNYPLQYQAVLDAVREGRIDIKTLNNAVIRILKWKQSLGLL